MDSHAPAPTPKKTAPYLFAVASPTAEMNQLAREALWMHAARVFAREVTLYPDGLLETLAGEPS